MIFKLPSHPINFTHKIAIFPLLLCFCFSLNAGDIREVKPLNFGVIALKDNNASYSMRITFAGQIQTDPAIVVIEPGHPAQYELTGFTANTPLNITVIVPSAQTQLAGASDPSTSQFTITDHHTFSPIISTDNLGNAIVNVGATLTTSGSGFYKDATYFSPMTIMVNY
ncbi:DUF4402 domain-containing protein [Psychrobium sp. nBUS_13]|uniref:DUF4402 domain-containing protein n=1 Tax=Psychrobium sp. nBUS_13 TaxID=3395319 RepID=UPI003EBF2653